MVVQIVDMCLVLSPVIRHCNVGDLLGLALPIWSLLLLLALNGTSLQSKSKTLSIIFFDHWNINDSIKSSFLTFGVIDYVLGGKWSWLHLIILANGLISIPHPMVAPIVISAYRIWFIKIICNWLIIHELVSNLIHAIIADGIKFLILINTNRFLSHLGVRNIDIILVDI